MTYEPNVLRTQTTPLGARYVEGAAATLVGATQPRLLQRELFENLNMIDPEFEALADELYTYDDELEQKIPSHVGHQASTFLQFAGQLCYLALGKKRTPFAKAGEYLQRIMEQKHGSVLEHANYTFLFLGVDRAMTHELVRHRAGASYSQVSQRYTGPDTLRFVMPYEDRKSPRLRNLFVRDIDTNLAQYQDRIEALSREYPRLDDEAPTEYRKRIQGSARSVLGNYVEAPIVVTANARAWRHILTMRCSRHADVRIREPMMMVLEALKDEIPELFWDFEETTLPDGSPCAAPKFEKP